METLEPEDIFSQNTRRRRVKARPSYLDCSDALNNNEDTKEGFDSETAIDPCYDDNFDDEEPVTIDLSEFLNENALLNEPSSENIAENNHGLTDCHSQFRVTNSFTDTAPVPLIKIPLSDDHVIKSNDLSNVAEVQLSKEEVEQSEVIKNELVLSNCVNAQTKENIVHGCLAVDTKEEYIKSNFFKTPMGLSNVIQNVASYSTYEDFNQNNLRTFGKYPIVKCEKLNIENYIKKFNIKVGNWPLLPKPMRNVNKVIRNLTKPPKRLKPPNRKPTKSFIKPIMLNKFLCDNSNESPMSIFRSILINSPSETSSLNNALKNTPKPKNLIHIVSQPLSRKSNFNSEMKMPEIGTCGKKVIKIISQKSSLQSSVSNYQHNKIYSNVNINKSLKKTILPKPVVETVVSPVLLKDYTVIEPYIEDPTSPVKPKPILTVPIDVVPPICANNQQRINKVKKSPKKTIKTCDPVFLNGTSRQIKSPNNFCFPDRTVILPKNVSTPKLGLKNVALDAQSAVVNAIENAFSSPQTKPHVNSKQVYVKVSSPKRKSFEGSLFGCQSYNSSLNDILFGFSESEDFTDEQFSLDSSVESVSEQCNSNIQESDLCNDMFTSKPKVKAIAKNSRQKILASSKYQKKHNGKLKQHDLDTLLASENKDQKVIPISKSNEQQITLITENISEQYNSNIQESFDQAKTTLISTTKQEMKLKTNPGSAQKILQPKLRKKKGKKPKLDSSKLGSDNEDEKKVLVNNVDYPQVQPSVTAEIEKSKGLNRSSSFQEDILSEAKNDSKHILSQNERSDDLSGEEKNSKPLPIQPHRKSRSTSKAENNSTKCQIPIDGINSSCLGNVKNTVVANKQIHTFANQKPIVPVKFKSKLKSKFCKKMTKKPSTNHKHIFRPAEIIDEINTITSGKVKSKANMKKISHATTVNKSNYRNKKLSKCISKSANKVKIKSYGHSKMKKKPNLSNKTITNETKKFDEITTLSDINKVSKPLSPRKELRVCNRKQISSNDISESKVLKRRSSRRDKLSPVNSIDGKTSLPNTCSDDEKNITTVICQAEVHRSQDYESDDELAMLPFVSDKVYLLSKNLIKISKNSDDHNSTIEENVSNNLEELPSKEQTDASQEVLYNDEINLNVPQMRKDSSIVSNSEDSDALKLQDINLGPSGNDSDLIHPLVNSNQRKSLESNDNSISPISSKTTNTIFQKSTALEELNVIESLTCLSSRSLRPRREKSLKNKLSMNIHKSFDDSSPEKLTKLKKCPKVKITVNKNLDSSSSSTNSLSRWYISERKDSTDSNQSMSKKLSQTNKSDTPANLVSNKDSTDIISENAAHTENLTSKTETFICIDKDMHDADLFLSMYDDMALDIVTDLITSVCANDKTLEDSHKIKSNLSQENFEKSSFCPVKVKIEPLDEEESDLDFSKSLVMNIKLEPAPGLTSPKHKNKKRSISPESVISNSVKGKKKKVASKSNRKSTSTVQDVTLYNSTTPKVPAASKAKTNFCPKAVTVPFLQGWMRELVHRQCENTSGKKASDVYYFTPEGKKLRSLVEISNYLSTHTDIKLTIKNFTFYKTLVYREPFEVERSAKHKSIINSSSLNKSSFSKQEKLVSATNKNKSLNPQKNKLTLKNILPESKNVKKGKFATNKTSSINISKSTIKIEPPDDESNQTLNKNFSESKNSPKKNSKAKTPFIDKGLLKIKEKPRTSTPVLTFNKKSGKLEAKLSPVVLEKKLAPQVNVSQVDAKIHDRSARTKKAKAFASPVENGPQIKRVKSASQQISDLSNYVDSTELSNKMQLKTNKNQPKTKGENDRKKLVQKQPVKNSSVLKNLVQKQPVNNSSLLKNLVRKQPVKNKPKLKHLLPKKKPTYVVLQSNPCSPRCLLKSYQDPTIQCAICLRLFHEDCYPSLAQGIQFACKTCTVEKLQFYKQQEEFPSSSLPTDETQLAPMPEDLDISLLFPEIELKEQSETGVYESVVPSHQPHSVIFSNSSHFPSRNHPHSFILSKSNINSSSSLLLSHLLRPNVPSCSSVTQQKPLSNCNSSNFSYSLSNSKSYVRPNCIPIPAPGQSVTLKNNLIIKHLPTKDNVHRMVICRKIGSPSTPKANIHPLNALERMSQNLHHSDSFVNGTPPNATIVSQQCFSYKNAAVPTISLGNNVCDTVNINCKLNMVSPVNVAAQPVVRCIRVTDGSMKIPISPDGTVLYDMNKFLSSYQCMNLIFKKLSIHDLLKVSIVCKSWQHLAMQPFLWEKISFSGLSITNWAKCCFYLQKVKTKYLDFTGIMHLSCHKMDWAPFCKNMVLLSGIQELKFDKLTPKILEAVAWKMPQLRKLECQFLTSPGLEPNIMLKTCYFNLSSLQNLHELVKLKINSTGGIRRQKGKVFELPHFPNLKHLALTGFQFESFLNLNKLSLYQNLISLELGDCYKIEPEIYFILKGLPQLRCIRLENGGSIDCELFSNALSEIEGLEVLELMNFKIPSNTADILKNFKHLIHLNIWPDNSFKPSNAQVNFNFFSAITNCKDLKYLCWGVISEEDSIPETLIMKDDASEEFTELSFEFLFTKLTDMLPECRVEVKHVPRNSWREFCSIRR